MCQYGVVLGRNEYTCPNYLIIIQIPYYYKVWVHSEDTLSL